MMSFRALFRSPQPKAQPSPEALADAVRLVAPYQETRRLLARVMEALKSSGSRSVAVLSLNAGEGKSVLCLSLAAAAVDLGLKVLVVDTATFVRDGAVALDEVLGVEAATGNAPVASPSLKGVDYLSWAVREGVRPEEGRAELARLGQGYGLILVDTAPLAALNRGNVDPHFCARAADAAIIVTSREGSLSEASRTAVGELRQIGVRLLGLVGNAGAMGGVA